jgi:uroporphyrinogen-III synthase
VDGLCNLFDMLGEDGRPRLIRTPVVVVSERMAQVCRELGFTTGPRLAATAGDDAILEAIQAWRDGQNTL